MRNVSRLLCILWILCIFGWGNHSSLAQEVLPTAPTRLRVDPTISDSSATYTATAVSGLSASPTSTGTTATPVELFAPNPEILTNGNTEPAKSKVNVKAGAPEGFEELEGPLDTTVDLHFGGLKIGVFRAVFTPGSILFSNPEEIVSKLPALDPRSSELVTQALTGDLPTHADRICGPIPKPDCGQLSPDIAAVIFDQERFQAELFVNPTYLSEQDTHTEKVLPPAPDIVSGVHSITGGLIGSPGEPNNYSLMSNSTLASGDTRLNFTGITASEQSRFQNLSASMDRWGLESKLGFFDSRPLQMLAQTPMTGISVGTSLDTNLAYRNTTGSRLSVFLPQRSYVSLIFNNMIYSTDFYEAGNQVLNTDILPDGAYEVTIRIVDTDGQQTEEKRFFSKNFQIPPADQPIYFGQLGTVRDTTQSGFLPDAGSGLISSFGVLSRYGESTGVALDSLVIKDRVYAEAGSFLLLPPDHQIRASLLLSSGKDFGIGGTYQGFALEKKFAFGANVRAIFAGETYQGSDELIPIKADTRQITANAGYQISDLANVNFLLDYNQVGSGQNRLSYGPSLRWDVWRDGVSNLSFGIDASQSNSCRVQNVMIRYTKRIGAWGLSGEALARRSSPSVSGGGSTNLTRNSRLTWNDDSTPGRLTIAGAEFRQDETSDNYLADLDHRGNLGNIKILGSQTRTNQVKRTIYSGNLGFGIAHTLNDIAWNGSQQQSSGVVIKTGGDVPPTPMKVVVDGSERSQFLTGESTALFLAPYQTYKISITPVESSPIDYDGTVKQITLYPGNVMPLEWEMSSIHVVLGRVVTEDGEPVANAKIEESGNLVMTDEDGLFQTELKEVEKITLFRAAQEHFAGKKHSKFTNGDSDMFTVMPPTRNSTATLTDPEKRELILQLFGDAEDVNPPGPPVEPPQSQAVAAESIKGLEVSTGTMTAGEVASTTAQVDVSAEQKPTPPLRPAFRCRVELPEAKEVNNVIMYSEPLICHSIPIAEAETNEDSATESDVLEDEAIETPENPLESLSESEEEPSQTHPESSTGEPSEDLAVPSGGTKAVQLGAFRSESQALESWSEFEKLSPIFQEIEPRVEIADLPGSGRFYRLRIVGFGSDAETAAFCRIVKNYGRDCIVVSQASRAIGKKQKMPKKQQVLTMPSLEDSGTDNADSILPEPQ